MDEREYNAYNQKSWMFPGKYSSRAVVENEKASGRIQ